YERAVEQLTGATGYSVDSGLGAFMDELARRRFVKAMKDFYEDRPDENYYVERLASSFKQNAENPDDPEDAGAWAMEILPGTNLNVAMFASGVGDGWYESYWGLDDDGNPVSIVTDFGIL